MTFKRLITSLVASAFLAGAAHAGGIVGASPDPAGLADWKRTAGKIVSHKMIYPVAPGRRELSEASVVVTAIVRPDGTVARAELTQPSGNRYFDRASEKLAKRLDRLPPLPESISTDGAEVRMHLLYARSQESLQKLQRHVVQMERIARTEAAEDKQLADSADQIVIDLFTGGR